MIALHNWLSLFVSWISWRYEPDSVRVKASGSELNNSLVLLTFVKSQITERQISLVAENFLRVFSLVHILTIELNRFIDHTFETVLSGFIEVPFHLKRLAGCVVSEKTILPRWWLTVLCAHKHGVVKGLTKYLVVFASLAFMVSLAVALKLSLYILRYKGNSFNTDFSKVCIDLVVVPIACRKVEVSRRVAHQIGFVAHASWALPFSVKDENCWN